MLSNTYYRVKGKTKRQQKKKQKFRHLFKIVLFILLPIVLLVIYFVTGYYIDGQIFDRRTNNPINLKIQSYRSVLNKAVLEASMTKPLLQELSTDGCIINYLSGEEECNMNALLYFSDPKKQPLFEKHLEELGWQNKTIKDTMLPDNEDTFFKIIDGLPVCLSIGKETSLSKYKNDLYINIDMVFCPDKNSDPAEAWSDWQIYFPSDIPSRYTIKHLSNDFSSGEIDLIYSQVTMQGVQIPHLEIEETKLPSTYNPPQACDFEISPDVLHACPLYLTTTDGRKIYQDSQYKDKSENVFYTSLNNTRIVIRKWYEPSNNLVLSDAELENVVASFTPISLSDLQKQMSDF